ncbi:response regulator [Sorangium sp. So ce385]|uniref:response regulator n=1 Tax=Sorangium sp. So ce385 TaxID=3133308 RepID=UPI003F5B4DD8
MSGDGRILIVDDDPAFLETYEDILAAEGYAVETATSHAEALRRLDEPGWAVVLVDRSSRAQAARTPAWASSARPVGARPAPRSSW